MTTTNSPIPQTSYFLLGVLAGGAAALLFAPWPGRVLRGKIRKGANDATAKVNEGVDMVKRRASQLASKAEHAIDAGKQRLAHEGQRLEAAVEAGKDALLRESVVEN